MLLKQRKTHIAELATTVASHVFPQLGIGLQEESARASIRVVLGLTLVNIARPAVHLVRVAVVLIVIASIDCRALLLGALR